MSLRGLTDQLTKEALSLIPVVAGITISLGERCFFFIILNARREAHRRLALDASGAVRKLSVKCAVGAFQLQSYCRAVCERVQSRNCGFTGSRG